MAYDKYSRARCEDIDGEDFHDEDLMKVYVCKKCEIDFCSFCGYVKYKTCEACF